MTETVLIAGATGYSGRYLVEEFASKPDQYNVKALVRRQPEPPFPENVELVMAEATKPETLTNVMDGVDTVVSAIGITRQRDGLTYQTVDYQANVNLLRQAENANVTKFGYIHVIHGDVIAKVSVGVAAKQAFVDELQSSTRILQTAVICPTGFFSDMNDFLEMAESGRVYLFGDGQFKLNPVHGADLAAATEQAMRELSTKKDNDDTNNDHCRLILPIGGPDIYTHQELATLALEVMEKPVRISYIWDGVRKFIAAVLPWVTPISIYGPAQFFLTAFDMDMVGECRGTRHLKDFWIKELAKKKESENQKKE